MVPTPTRPKRSRSRIALWTLAGLMATSVAIQFVPYGRDHAQPPARNPFRWNSPAAEGIARAACYDCHSTETKWWWAVKVAPFSWLAQHDINGARRHVNFSDWDGALNAGGIQRAIQGDMPPLPFTLVHPEARLTEAEKQTLLKGFQASLAGNAGLGPVADARSSATPGSSAVTIIQASCRSCHPAAFALQYRTASAGRAKALLDRMVRHGARLSAPAEQTLINQFIRRG